MADKPDYQVQSDSLQREGRRVSLETWTDISPENYLMLRLELKVRAIANRTADAPHPMPSTWRKRMAHVTET